MLIFKLPFILTGKRKKRKNDDIVLFYTFLFRSKLAAWKIIRGWLPTEAEQFIKFVDVKDIGQYIRSDQLSVSMGGTVSLIQLTSSNSAS